MGLALVGVKNYYLWRDRHNILYVQLWAQEPVLCLISSILTNLIELEEEAVKFSHGNGVLETGWTRKLHI